LDLLSLISCGTADGRQRLMQHRAEALSDSHAKEQIDMARSYEQM
jgi:hypothetical protein